MTTTLTNAATNSTANSETKSGTRTALAAPTKETADAAEIVERFLEASMVPDPVTAATYVSSELRITFTGGRKYSHPRETAAFNAGRYSWVKKRFERTDVVPAVGETIVRPCMVAQQDDD